MCPNSLFLPPRYMLCFIGGGSFLPITLWLIVLSGNTYPIHRQIAAFGGRWSSRRKAWFIDNVPTRTAWGILRNVRSGVWPEIDLTIKPQKVIRGKETLWTTKTQPKVSNKCPK